MSPGSADSPSGSQAWRRSGSVAVLKTTSGGAEMPRSAWGAISVVLSEPAPVHLTTGIPGEVLGLQLGGALQMIGERGVRAVAQRVHPGAVQAAHFAEQVLVAEIGRVDADLRLGRRHLVRPH